MSKTFNQISNDTMQFVGTVAGTNTQVYLEPRIKQYIQECFDELFDEYPWSDYLDHYTYTLDGSTGLVTATVTDDIVYWRDLIRIMPGTNSSSLPRLPSSTNPAGIATGATPTHVAPTTTANKLFKVYPIAATGNVTVLAKVRPQNAFANNDVIKMDNLMLQYGAALKYLAFVGGNPTATQLVQNLYTERVKAMKGNDNHLPVSTDVGGTTIPTNWF